MEVNSQPKVKINMLTGTDDTASAVVEIDGQVSVISAYPMEKNTPPPIRDQILIDRAYYLQGKTRIYDASVTLICPVCGHRHEYSGPTEYVSGYHECEQCLIVSAHSRAKVEARLNAIGITEPVGNKDAKL